MKRTTITISCGLLDNLVAVTGAKNKSQAVAAAVEEEIKRKKWQKIKTMAGKLEFCAGADELRHGDHRLG